MSDQPGHQPKGHIDTNQVKPPNTVPSNMQPINKRVKCSVIGCPGEAKDGFEFCHGHEDAIAAEARCSEATWLVEEAKEILRQMYVLNEVPAGYRQVVATWLEKYERK